MYVPRHFQLPQDYATAMLAQPRSGNLVTVHDDGPASTLVPFHLDEERGVLVTHLVRNNPQARKPILGPGLVILDDADAYITPQWYATSAQDPDVPTWDYITLHIRGRVRIDPSPQAALAAARELTTRMEPPELLQAVGEESLTAMSRAIVAVEVTIEHIEGKAKMSQNRRPEDIRSLITALEQHGQHTLADFLREVSLPYAEQRFATLDRLHRAAARPPE